MRVTMRSLSSGPNGQLLPGNTYDVPDDEAKQLIAGQYAVPADRSTKGGRAERATTEAPAPAVVPPATHKPKPPRKPS